MKTSRLLLHILKLILGFSIITFLLYKLDINAVMSVLANAKIGFVLIALALLLAFFFLSAFSLKYLMAPIKDVSLKNFVRYYMFSYGFSLFLPGQLGELSIPYFLKKDKVGLGESMPVYIVTKMLSFIIICLIAFCGIIFISGAAVNLLLFPIIILAAIVLIASALFSNFGRRIIKDYILRSYAKHFSGFSESLYSIFKTQKKRLAVVLAIALLKWILYGFLISSLFLALGTKVPVLSVILISSIGSVVSFIPITPQGLGLRESLSVILFSSIGIAAPTVAAAYLINLAICYLVGGTSLILYLLNRQTLNISTKTIENKND